MATDSRKWEGTHADVWGPQALLERMELVRSHSMDITNDPRFYQDNVINYRLNAFAGLGMVSGFLVGVAQGEVFAMNKNMALFTAGSGFDVDGILQLVSFFMLCLVFFANILGLYISVAQPYHTLRLMTAGPTGFETAASYYLNRNMVAWRHLAIKWQLQSLPLFIVQCGLRLIVKFDRGTMVETALPLSPPMHARLQGWVFCFLFAMVAAAIWYCHIVHFAVFREQYTIMVTRTTPHHFTKHMQQTMTPRAHSSKPSDFDHLDV
jgi:hypothetical protein